MRNWWVALGGATLVDVTIRVRPHGHLPSKQQVLFVSGHARVDSVVSLRPPSRSSWTRAREVKMIRGRLDCLAASLGDLGR